MRNKRYMDSIYSKSLSEYRHRTYCAKSASFCAEGTYCTKLTQAIDVSCRRHSVPALVPGKKVLAILIEFVSSVRHVSASHLLLGVCPTISGHSASRYLLPVLTPHPELYGSYQAAIAGI